jgi:hypothetical protein
LPQQEPGQRRAERQCVECGQHNGDGDGHGELLMEPSSDSRNKRGWHKDGRENQGNSNHRPGEFVHGFSSRVLGIQAFLDVALHTFDNDDRVVDHQADSEYQPEQRKRVNGETEQRKEDKGSN